jgi:hypothetical protein
LPAPSSADAHEWGRVLSLSVLVSLSQPAQAANDVEI